MNYSSFLCALTVLLSVTVSAQSEPPPREDTTRTYRLEELVVTARRLPQTPWETSVSVTIINREEIEKTGAQTLADVVSVRSGIFVKDYGGSSALKTISQRGLGTEHTVVLLNGQRVSLFQNGLFDLGLLPVHDAGKIEIIRGGYSAGVGADAIAGVINIVTRPPSERMEVSLASSVGSSGYQMYRVSAGASAGGVAMRASYGEERARNDFPFLFHDGSLVTRLQRRNADVHARNLSLQGEWHDGNTIRITFHGSAHQSGRGVAGLVLNPAAAGNARQADDDYIGQAGYLLSLDDVIEFRSQLQLHYFRERYRDPDLVIGGAAVDNHFKNVDLRWENRTEIRIDDDTRLCAGIEAANVRADGNSLARKTERSQLGLFTAMERCIAFGADSMTVSPALRFDAVPSVQAEWSPQLGVALGFRALSLPGVGEVQSIVKGSISRNYRLPTFNELYYGGGGGRGNPDLGSEHATALDGAAGLSFDRAGRHDLIVSLYRTTVDDRIVWVAAGGGNVTPKNIRRVLSNGWELEYNWSLPSTGLAASVNYTSVTTTKQTGDFPGDPTPGKYLTYVPGEMLKLRIGYSRNLEAWIVRNLHAGIEHQFTGFFYTTEDNEKFLPSFSVTDITAGVRAAIGTILIRTMIEVRNIFNTDYQVILAYPMPLRSYRLTVGLEY